MIGRFEKCLLLLVLVFQSGLGYIEIVNTYGCESCPIRLTCRHLNATIAVLEANFTATEDNSTFILRPTAFPRTHPRDALNQRCSGVNHCSFILTKDCPGANFWGPGNLTVKYACVSARRMTTYCNVEINLPSREGVGVSDGFVHNPGYPRFYTGPGECKWTIKAPPHQTIKVEIVDLSLTEGHIQDPSPPDEILIPEDPPPPPDFNEDCLDFLLVKNNGQTIYTACASEDPAATISSTGESLEVVLVTSKSMTPQRGVLFYYTAVGCAAPPPPVDGYLIFRNDSVASFSCCVGFVFPDTGERERVISCLGHEWDTVLPFPDCENTSLSSIGKQELTTALSKMSSEQSSLSDIIIPSLVIVMLFVINCIIVFFIYKYRQRRAGDYVDEELGTLNT